jgi:hypothetical protein
LKADLESSFQFRYGGIYVRFKVLRHLLWTQFFSRDIKKKHAKKLDKSRPSYGKQIKPIEEISGEDGTDSLRPLICSVLLQD